MSKYHNVQKTVDGIVFDSTKEANRYGELKLLERAKEITNLVLQPSYELLPGFVDRTGKKQRPITYIPDFRYTDKKKGIIVEDVKGMKTKEYMLKKKMFMFFHPDVTFLET